MINWIIWMNCISILVEQFKLIILTGREVNGPRANSWVDQARASFRFEVQVPGAIKSRIFSGGYRNQRSTLSFKSSHRYAYIPLGWIVCNSYSRCLAGGEQTEAGKAAIESLVSVYANWVPREQIITTNLWSSELSKVLYYILWFLWSYNTW